MRSLQRLDQIRAVNLHLHDVVEECQQRRQRERHAKQSHVSVLHHQLTHVVDRVGVRAFRSLVLRLRLIEELTVVGLRLLLSLGAVLDPFNQQRQSNLQRVLNEDRRQKQRQQLNVHLLQYCLVEIQVGVIHGARAWTSSVSQRVIRAIPVRRHIALHHHTPADVLVLVVHKANARRMAIGLLRGHVNAHIVVRAASRIVLQRCEVLVEPANGVVGRRVLVPIVERQKLRHVLARRAAHDVVEAHIVPGAFLRRTHERQVKQRRETVDELEAERLGHQCVLVVLLGTVILPLIAVRGHRLVDGVEHEDHHAVHHSHADLEQQVVGVVVARQQHRHHRRHTARQPHHHKRVNGGHAARTLEKGELLDPEASHRVVRPVAIELRSRHRLLLKLGHAPLHSISCLCAQPKIHERHAPENDKKTQQRNADHGKLALDRLPHEENNAHNGRRDEPTHVKLQKRKVEAHRLAKVVAQLFQRAPQQLARRPRLDPVIVEVLQAFLVVQREHRRQRMALVQQAVLDLDLGATLVGIRDDRLVDDAQTRLLIKHRLHVAVARNAVVVLVDLRVRLARKLAVHEIPVRNVERLRQVVVRCLRRARISSIQLGSLGQCESALATNRNTTDRINQQIRVTLVCPQLQVRLRDADHQKHHCLVFGAIRLHRQFGRLQSLPKVVEDLSVILVLRHAISPFWVRGVVRHIFLVLSARFVLLLLVANIKRQDIVK
mmetsp:Transcript_14296/g.21595  ORF Transcript_14296/g.21595 Transcript_14296/m.21595 type:complete len:719 (-) Transcript_14296:394-2550(-)